jgi:hypothetical protein
LLSSVHKSPYIYTLSSGGENGKLNLGGGLHNLLDREVNMPFVTAIGERRPLDVDWNGVKSCPDFTIREGQTFGEAARLSDCNCEFHRMLRSDDESEDLDS